MTIINITTHLLQKNYPSDNQAKSVVYNKCIVSNIKLFLQLKKKYLHIEED